MLVSGLTTLEDEILTTAGITRLTTAEYPRPAAASDRVAVLTVAGGFSCSRTAARNPRKPVTASAVPKETVASQCRPLKNVPFIFSCHLVVCVLSLIRKDGPAQNWYHRRTQFQVRPEGSEVTYGLLGSLGTVERVGD